ncbi:MAG: T9SS type A sorting domain-containing protein [candidate division Zixibacteria bacterium]|nr:T9SS type A sorting domain-containing protein [candidate division Zixibacteria bacterium]
MIRISGLIILYLLLFTPEIIALDTLWTETYGGEYQEYLETLERTSDGGYILAGSTNSFTGDWDFYLVKIDSLGDTLWTRLYGGTENDEAYAAIQTSDGGYLLAGYSRAFGEYTGDVYYVKTDEFGNEVWNKSIGGDSWDVARSVMETNDGGYLISGWTQSFGAGDRDIYIIKTDENGDTLWSRTYGGYSRDEGWDATQVDNGGYIILGSTASFGQLATNIWILKLFSNGDTLSTLKKQTDNREYAYSMERTSDEGYIIAGYVETQNHGNNYVLGKVNEYVGDEWVRLLGGASDDEAHYAQQTIDGGYVISGRSTSFGNGDSDFHIIKTDTLGREKWSKTFGGYEDEGAAYNRVIVRQAPDGSYMVAGSTRSFGNGGYDFWLLKVVIDFKLEYNEEDFDTGIYADSLVHLPFDIYSQASSGYVKPICDSSWVSFYPDSVYLDRGDTVTVEAEVNPESFTQVNYSTSIYFDSNQPGLEDTSISMNLIVYPQLDVTVSIEDEELFYGDTLVTEFIASNPTSQSIPIWIEAVVSPVDDTMEWTSLSPKMFFILPYGTVSGTFRNTIPQTAPPGMYEHLIRISPHPEVYPLIGSDIAQFRVIGKAHVPFQMANRSRVIENSWSMLDYDIYQDKQSKGTTIIEAIRSDEDLYPVLRNNPNPFNAATTISFVLSEESYINLSIFNIQGKRIENLQDGILSAGSHQIRWDASQYPSGIYLVLLNSDNFTISKRILLLK